MNISTNTLSAAINLLHQGKLVAFPTETVYGLGADATNPEAVAKIFAAKGRPTNHPLIVHLASIEQFHQWAITPSKAALTLADYFWPGPLTLIVQRVPQVLLSVTGGQETVGLRMPRHPIAQALLRGFGKGIAAPSANRFGCLSPTSAEHVRQSLGDRVDLILDGGDCEVGIESTIIDCSSDTPRLLRQGAITASQITAILGYPIAIGGDNANTPRVSGSLPAHYAPRTPLQSVLTEKMDEALSQALAEGQTIAVLARRLATFTHPRLEWTMMPMTPEDYAHVLYAVLHDVDNKRYCDQVWVEAVPTGDSWDGIRDRLSRAAV